jgi:hypothetical protein
MYVLALKDFEDNYCKKNNDSSFLKKSSPYTTNVNRNVSTKGLTDRFFLRGLLVFLEDKKRNLRLKGFTEAR